jgi:membrane-associated phospholipid phosphatase
MPSSPPPSLLPVNFKMNRRLWIAIGALLIPDILLMWYLGIGIEIAHASDIAWLVGGMLALCLAINIVRPRFRRNDSALDTLWLLANFANQIALASLGIAIFSYLTSRLNLPLIDGGLIAFDRLFGFDWLTYVRWVDKYPVMSDIFSIGYDSVNLQMMIFFVLLPVAKQFSHTQRFVMIFLSSAFITVVLAALLPSIGGYLYYNINVLRDFPHLRPQGGLVHKPILLGMRDHTLMTISFPLYGIVTFPSFHAALAIMLSYASLPFRRYRLLIIPLNIVMLFATLVEGGHYLTDVLAGSVITGLAIYGAERLLPRSQFPNKNASTAAAASETSNTSV